MQMIGGSTSFVQLYFASLDSEYIAVQGEVHN